MAGEGEDAVLTMSPTTKRNAQADLRGAAGDESFSFAMNQQGRSQRLRCQDAPSEALVRRYQTGEAGVTQRRANGDTANVSAMPRLNAIEQVNKWACRRYASRQPARGHKFRIRGGSSRKDVELLTVGHDYLSMRVHILPQPVRALESRFATNINTLVPQWIRGLAYEARGRTFNSCQGCHTQYRGSSVD